MHPSREMRATHVVVCWNEESPLSPLHPVLVLRHLTRSVSFADIAGADEAKVELAELVDFLGEGAAR